MEVQYKGRWEGGREGVGVERETVEDKGEGRGRRNEEGEGKRERERGRGRGKEGEGRGSVGRWMVGKHVRIDRE